MIFSVIVPVFNSEQYLEQCLESIVNQTFCDFELIIINDGSTDSSGIICDEFMQKDDRIKVLHCLNGGVVKARKRGVAEAKGDYVVWVDSDDYIDKDYLEAFAAAIKAHNPDVVSCGFVREKDNNASFRLCEKKIFQGEELTLFKESLLFDEKRKGLNLGSFSVNLWSKALRLSMARKYQMSIPDHLRMGEDIAVTMPLLMECSSVEQIDACGYHYRVNSSSMSSNFDVDEIKKSECLIDYLTFALPDSQKYKVEYLWLYFIRRYTVGLAVSSDSVFSFSKKMKELNIKVEKESITKRIFNNWKLADRLFAVLSKSRKYTLLYLMIRLKTRRNNHG